MSCTKNIDRGCCFGRDRNGEATAENIKGSHKMEVSDWLNDTPNPLVNNNIYEIQFKNTRKSYFDNGCNLELTLGDVVVVESAPGIDIGIVTLTGDLVTKQMQKTRFSPQDLEFKKIIRKAKPHDIEKWQESIALEHNTMIRSRQITADLGLKMKIGDVEYQADRLKAIFYYIADDRVDFRELIKILAEQFRIRVEMKQIGARQEAGRIGGISACGRQLCCSTWLNSFQSVTIGSARHQEISLNPQKLAGQCGKLKCCLNYEVDNYIDARKEFPKINAPLEALDGTYHLVKSDTFKKIMWFSPDAYSSSIMIPLSIDRVRKIVAMNRRGEKVDKIEDISLVKQVVEEPKYMNVVGEESITRFDKSANNSGRRGSNSRNRNNRNNTPGQDNQAENSQRQPGEKSNQRPPREARTRNESGTPNEQRPARESNERRPQNGRNTQRPERTETEPRSIDATAKESSNDQPTERRQNSNRNKNNQRSNRNEKSERPATQPRTEGSTERRQTATLNEAKTNNQPGDTTRQSGRNSNNRNRNRTPKPTQKNE